MNNYLLQLLKEVKTLIIPGLGALTVTNETTGEILFMPYLKFDDGTLAKHIAEKEKIDQNDASNLISKFVREVTAELDKGNSYDMYQFGRFVKIDGEIAFETWQSGKSDAPADQKEEPKAASVIPVQEVIEPKPIVKEEKVVPPPVVEEPKAPVETPKKEEETVLPKTDVPGKEEKPKDEKIVVENLKVVEAKIIPPAVEKPTPKAPEKPVQAKKEPIKKEKVVAKEPKEKKKTSVFAYVLWGFLVLILGSGTFIAIQFDTLKKDFPILADLAGENDDIAKGSEDVKQLEEDPDVNGDSETEAEPIPEDQVHIVEDQLPDEKVVEKPKKTDPAPKKETPAPKPTPQPVKKATVTVNKKPVTKNTASSGNSAVPFDSSKSFHIIAGSFGSETNANKLAGKLRNQGFSEASVTMNNGMYRVSIKGFGTLNEATAEAAKVQSSVPGAWVLKM